MRRLLTHWFPLAVWLAAIWWQSSRPGGPAPINEGFWFAVTTLGHLVEYGVLGFLLGRLLPLGAGSRSWALAWAFCVLWGVTDEVHQSFVPGREVGLWDLLVDAASAAAGLAVNAALRRAHLRAGMLGRLAGPP